MKCDKGQLWDETVKRKESNVLRKVHLEKLSFLPLITQTLILTLLGLVRTESWWRHLLALQSHHVLPPNNEILAFLCSKVSDIANAQLCICTCMKLERIGMEKRNGKSDHILFSLFPVVNSAAFEWWTYNEDRFAMNKICNIYIVKQDKRNTKLNKTIVKLLSSRFYLQLCSSLIGEKFSVAFQAWDK